MPSHSTRVQAAGLPDDYQFGDAGKRPSVKVSRATFLKLVELVLLTGSPSSRLLDYSPMDNQFYNVVIAGTTFEPDDRSERCRA